MPSHTDPTSPNSITRSLLLPYQAILILAGISAFSVGMYVLTSHFYFRLGFPLDDAWIHQTYARNLALNGEWSLIPGQPSGGSTAPLWSALLALGYLLGIAPFVWTCLLGTLTLFGLSWLIEYAIRERVAGYRPRFPWFGALIACEWHLVWAAGSGMETILFTFLVTSVLVYLVLGKRNYVGIGLLIGLSVWIRPDGVTLLGPAVVSAFLVEIGLIRRVRTLGNLFLGFGVLFILYLVFNLKTAGMPLPSTFYAKQVEYVQLHQISFLKRLLTLSVLPWIGVSMALLPGVFYWFTKTIGRRDWGTISGILWFIGYLLLFAWRLPVTYQHGRYLIPTIAIALLWGALGMIELIARHILPRVGVVFWQLCVASILIAFWGRGAVLYAQDVAIIESEMVVTAQWVADQLSLDDLVATHDIGAMGYFGNHQLVDLAGLITPQVIPFLRDEQLLADYLDQRGVDALVAFPGWYPQLVRGRAQLFCSKGVFAPTLGGENMVVYRWSSP